MPDLPGLPSTITCPSCGFENATTSLYCQDCGVRLIAPPSSIVQQAAPEASGVEQTATGSKKKPRILSANRENHVGSFFIITLRALILAAIVALVVLVFRAPAGLPQEEMPLSADIVGNIRAGMARNAQVGKPVNVPWSGQGLNAFVAGALALSNPDLTALFAPDENGFTLFVRHKIGSMHIYSTTHYRLIARGNGIGVIRTGSSIGCLPVPKWAAPAMSWADAGVVEALAPDVEFLRNAASVQTDALQVHVNFGAPTQ
jgi:hypothetical protein